MNVAFRESFEKDLLRINNSIIFKQVKKLIMKLETASDISKISNIKKLAGNKNFYRIRLGDYRVGIILNKDSIELIRILHRKEIYRYFPLD